ncbi:MAG: IS3 family transposase [Fodinibius sp.]|nr:IS3 family transposase [Fodinibius sp.]
MNYSLNALYKVAGVTKQAVWAHCKRERRQLELTGNLMKQVDGRRAQHPGCGLEKLYWHLQPEGIGRDRFCSTMMALGYGVRRTPNNMRTTFPAHKVFDNLIEGRVVTGPNQVWQSDITYIKVGDMFYYLTFIIDVYSRRIVGYATSKNLRAEANLRALKQALSSCSPEELQGLVHHSDRGSQYTDGRYLALLRSYNILISMGKIATDNAFAERINGTIKNEYLLPKQPKCFRQLKKLARQAVKDYNTVRKHNALGRKVSEDLRARMVRAYSSGTNGGNDTLPPNASSEAGIFEYH